MTKLEHKIKIKNIKKLAKIALKLKKIGAIKTYLFLSKKLKIELIKLKMGE